ncbi:MAG: DUF5654 family protein [Nanoarchaeota archaeon]
MKSEIIEKLSILSTGAFGLVAALAWNEAIQGIFKQVFGEQSSIPAMFSYALLVTAVAVIVTIWTGRIAEKAKNAELRSIFRRKKEAQEATKQESKK